MTNEFATSRHQQKDRLDKEKIISYKFTNKSKT